MFAGKKRVVIVGAGLVGLGAARELPKHNFDVVVVEARKRIGGPKRGCSEGS